MSKRFIDTDLFEDLFFMNLTIEGKILWIYFITKCDHAGIIELNSKLIKFLTGIEKIEPVIKQLSNRLVTVKKDLYFIPKYIDFQYPNFPNSKVRQQESAIEILKKHGLFNEENQTINKHLTKGYVNGNDTDTDNDNESVIVIPSWAVNFKNYRPSILYPFECEQFAAAWDYWIRYRAEQGFKSYKPIGEQNALGRIRRLSGGDLLAALEIIKQSIENTYQGLFEIKGNGKQKQSATSDQQLARIVDCFFAAQTD